VDVIPLSPRTEECLTLQFAEADRDPARVILETECGANVPSWRSAGLERLRLAALKLSDGDLSKLQSAVDLAKIDFRDVLMAAGFGGTNSHHLWAPSGDGIDVTLIRWMLSMTPAERLKYAESRLAKTIDTLFDAGLEFIIVGGVSAILHGAPMDTADLDILYKNTPENICRLDTVMETLGAVDREDQQLQDRRSLATNNGQIDMFEKLDGGMDHEVLFWRSEQMHVTERANIRVLDLDVLIQIKTQRGGQKDLAMLPLLRRTLAEKRKT
jgi:hypothetical protein